MCKSLNNKDKYHVSFSTFNLVGMSAPAKKYIRGLIEWLWMDGQARLSNLATHPLFLQWCNVKHIFRDCLGVRYFPLKFTVQSSCSNLLDRITCVGKSNFPDGHHS